MLMNKRIFSVLLLSILLLTSCGRRKDGVQTPETTDLTTTVVLETSATEETETTLSLITDGKFTFTIMRSEEASSAMVSNAKALHKNLEKYT